MTLLRHLMAGWRPEGAATKALAYILNPSTSPGVAGAFVKLLGPAGVPAFVVHRVDHEAHRSDDSHPDLTIRDPNGTPRVLVATTFWKGVHDSQPASCLRKLPEDALSALVFIAPRERIRGLWSELRTRCQDNPRLDLRDGSSRAGDPAWARIGRNVLMIASWQYVLDSLTETADPSIQQDVVELLGLVDQTDRQAFLPLDANEVTEVGLARRLIGYRKLVDEIATRLEESGVAKLESGNPYFGSYRDGWMRYRTMRVRDEFDMRLGIQVKAWRDLGITPLWWMLRGTVGHWQRIKTGLDEVRSYRGQLHIPIPLSSDAEEGRMIDAAVDRIGEVAHRLVTSSRGMTSCGPSRPPTRQSLLGHVLPSIQPPEPAATRALHYVLEAAPDIASAFVERLMGGGFEIGPIVSEWKFGGIQPDLTVFDVHREARLFIENKFEASLTKNQPVEYLKRLPRDGQSMLAFIAPEDRAEGLWAELKKRCGDAGYTVAEESSTKHFRRMRVAKRRLLLLTSWRWVLLTSWGWALDTLQQAAAAGGHDAVERNIFQLRGLTERTTSSSVSAADRDEPPDAPSDARHVGRLDATEEHSGASPFTDWRVARRVANYTSLIDGITDRLVNEGVGDTKGLNRSGWGRFLRVRTKFGLWLGVDLHTWRDRGITPIWSSFSGSGFGGRMQQTRKLFPDAFEENGRLYVPVRLQTGVERDRVIDHAFKQIVHTADTLLEAFPEE